jgi:hypothetical protein
MLSSSFSHKNIAAILAIVIALFSIGTVVADNCHASEAETINIINHHEALASPQESGSHSDLTNQMCAGGFILLLLLVLRKFVLKRLLFKIEFFSVFRAKLTTFRNLSISCLNTTSIYSLGVIRI